MVRIREYYALETEEGVGYGTASTRDTPEVSGGFYNPKLPKPKLDQGWRDFAKMKSEEKEDLKRGCTEGYWHANGQAKPVYISCKMISSGREWPFTPTAPQKNPLRIERETEPHMEIPCTAWEHGEKKPEGCVGWKTPLDFVCRDCAYFRNFTREQVEDWDADNEVAYSPLEMRHILEGHNVQIRDWRIGANRT
jgi:hypothetical protein